MSTDLVFDEKKKSHRKKRQKRNLMIILHSIIALKAS
jgi:hypothetical protein